MHLLCLYFIHIYVLPFLLYSHVLFPQLFRNYQNKKQLSTTQQKHENIDIIYYLVITIWSNLPISTIHKSMHWIQECQVNVSVLYTVYKSNGMQLFYEFDWYWHWLHFCLTSRLIRKMVGNSNKQLENLCYGNYLVGKY